MNVMHTPKQNYLLSALPEADRDRLLPYLELVPLPLGHVVYESGRTQPHAYFPTTSLVALLCGTENGASAEIAVCGKEGSVGVTVVLGAGSTSNRAVVQSGGYGYRIKAAFLKIEFERDGALRPLLLRYMQVLMTQMGQTAACNGLHTVEQRLCRWLLATTDRLSSNELKITQELIANMLGVRRERVTEAAGKLQSAGLITNSRGRISVCDRAKLERQACECYAIVRNEMERLIPAPEPAVGSTCGFDDASRSLPGSSISIAQNRPVNRAPAPMFI